MERDECVIPLKNGRSIPVTLHDKGKPGAVYTICFNTFDAEAFKQFLEENKDYIKKLLGKPK